MQKVEVKWEEVFEMERTPLLYTRAPGHFQENQQIERVSHTDVIKKAVQL